MRHPVSEAGGRGFESRRAHNPSPSPECSSRFWDKVDRTAGPDACWPWTGSRTKDGYGRFGGGYAHRHALELTLGRPLDPGEQALHDPKECNRPECCNALHLRPGTVGDNARDRIIAGTQPHARVLGEDNASSKLTSAAVVEMRGEFAGMKHGAKGAFVARWAAKLGVCGRTVEHALYGKTWTHLPLADARRVRRLAAQVAAGRLSLAAAEAKAVRR